VLLEDEPHEMTGVLVVVDHKDPEPLDLGPGDAERSPRDPRGRPIDRARALRLVAPWGIVIGMARGAAGTALTRQSIRLHQRFLLLGGTVYLAWWFVVHAVLPDSYNPLAGRLGVVALFYATLGATFFSEWMRRHGEEGLALCVWVLTVHYYHLFYRNGGDSAWAVGAYVVVVAVSAVLSSLQSLFAYSLLTVALGVSISLLERSLLHTIFLPGLVTMTIVSNLALRYRLLLEQERLELARAQAARAAAEAEVALRDEFISIASHELNTPLATLKLSFKQISRAATSADEPASLRAVAPAAERCERQLVRLVRLVDALLDASQIASGTIPLQIETVCLMESVRDAVHALAEEATRAGSLVEVTGDGTVTGQWDPTRVEQLITNLVRNAVTFGRGLPVRVTVSGDANRARLVVADQGIGIPRDQHARIFDRFQRAVSAQHYGGLGLGLYVVKQVVDAHGGSVRVESDPGSGAVFTVELPRGSV
jgi:signal transduction histidine kinase